MAKKLFVRASSSEFRARHLCRRFQSEIVRAKAFPRYRHLPKFTALTRFCVAPVTFPWQDVKAFEMAAIEYDAGTKTASHDVLSDKILRK